MKRHLVLCIALIVVASSQAEIGRQWRPSSGTLWSTAANWSGNDVPDNLKPGATVVYKAQFLDNWDQCLLDYDGPTIFHLQAVINQSRYESSQGGI